ncbi:Phosphatidylglycerol/phosphatidylinositol transfer protein [Hypocenomyce scalaris]|nr:Phosphatidylglycerol/phosphatidylinositol transfer protein [Hypocenomyce scalaris]
MKFATTLLPLLLPALATSRSISVGKQDVLTNDSDLNVPGANPMIFCQDPTDDILTIQHVNLSPNPPTAGNTLTIEAVGTFSEDVEEGAYVNLQVKYGLIRLINQTADLCDQLKNVDQDCPVKKGETKITKDVDLPNQIPPGQYTVLADVYTKDHKKITCLQAQVHFGSNQ